MSGFGSAAIDKNGLGAGISPDFPLVPKLARRESVPQIGQHTNPHREARYVNNMFAFKRGAPSFESNQCAWLIQAKNLSGLFMSRRYPAARDLCGNGCVQKHVAKTGGVYE